MMMMATAMTVVVATEVMAMPLLTEDRSKVEADCEEEYSLK